MGKSWEETSGFDWFAGKPGLFSIAEYPQGVCDSHS
jgi:hypothetical protein